MPCVGLYRARAGIPIARLDATVRSRRRQAPDTMERFGARARVAESRANLDQSSSAVGARSHRNPQLGRINDFGRLVERHSSGEVGPRRRHRSVDLL